MLNFLLLMVALPFVILGIMVIAFFTLKDKGEVE